MRLIIKKLQGGECLLEVEPNMLIVDIKKQISRKLGVPVKEQKLLLLGRTLADNQTVASYNTLKDGSKLYLVIKKPDTVYDAMVRHFKRRGLNDAEARTSARKVLHMLKMKINRMSWDDIDRLCLHCMMDERGERPPANRN